MDADELTMQVGDIQVPYPFASATITTSEQAEIYVALGSYSEDFPG